MVCGTGPIGLAIIQCLKAIDAGEIIAVEVAARRQELAKQFGATHILDPTQVDVTKAALDLTGGWGPPVAFECSGVLSSLESAIRAVRARGTIMNVSIVSRCQDSLDRASLRKEADAFSCSNPKLLGFSISRNAAMPFVIGDY